MSIKERVNDPLVIMEFLHTVDLYGLKYHQEKLLAIKQWGIDQLGIKVGDRVKIKNYTPTRGDGWWAHRESLVNGAFAEVMDIDFSIRSNCWYADIILEKEWAVSDWGASGLRRYDYEGDQKHTFMFSIKKLQKVEKEKGS